MPLIFPRSVIVGTFSRSLPKLKRKMLLPSRFIRNPYHVPWSEISEIPVGILWPGTAVLSPAVLGIFKSLNEKSHIYPVAFEEVFLYSTFSLIQTVDEEVKPATRPWAFNGKGNESANAKSR